MRVERLGGDRVEGLTTMRINWCDEEERPGQFALWQANCERSMRGKRGRQALLDLEAELLSMTDKRLIGDDLAANGEVCAVGALMRHRGVDQQHLEQLNDSGLESDELAVREAKVPSLVAWNLVELNDIELEHATPEERYQTVLSRVQTYLENV